MTWPDSKRIDTVRSTCPDCGADDTQLGERSVSTRVQAIVDKELKLLVEATCPCGYEDKFTVTAE
ncbi:hypothetical protein [Natrinema sp. H-ect4]|uniref:hypothetical protein n=1 Tax=Natrinema sp. H-ect4 TaxID=3242699 RepID=UPI0035A9A74D